MMVTLLFVLHGLSAMALLGAVTHQASSVWLPVRRPNAGFVGRFRMVKAANYTNAIIVLYLSTFTLGSLVYPAYRIGARIYLENLRMSALVGSFEMKEHLVTFGIALLPAYWYFWKHAPSVEHDRTRKVLTLLLAGFVWSAFLIGYVLNNVRGV
jgi:hypothetical protein